MQEDLIKQGIHISMLDHFYEQQDAISSPVIFSLLQI